MVLRLLLGLFASISLGVVIVNGLEGMGIPILQAKLLVFFVGTFTFHGVALVLIDLFLRQHEIGWLEAFGFSSPRLGRTLLLALLVGVVVLPIAWSLSHLSARTLEMLRIKVELQQAVQTLQMTESPWHRLYFGLVAIFLAPFVEELVFRGILYPALKQSGRRRLALWGTSLLFAASHANMMTFVPLTFLALILTLLYETTGNLTAPIVTHSLFNAANFFWLVTDMRATALFQ